MMAGYLLTTEAKLQCAHSGQAEAQKPNPRVKVNGHPVLTQPLIYTVSGCKNPPQSGGPCATANWATVSTRITVQGQPVLLQDSQAICTPTGTPLTIVSTQERVKAM